MKPLILAALALVSSAGMAQDREGLLRAWEDIQKHHPEVSQFQASGTPGEYSIKFERFPFSGTLKVLVYDFEDIPGDFGEGIAKTGYVEFELVGASPDELAKYGRPYFKWQQSNSLFYDETSQRWISAEAYSQLQQERLKSEMPGEAQMFFWEYSNYVLVAVVLYFFFTSFGNNKKVKLSVEAQKRAEARINESIEMQKVAIEESKQQTELLREIRDFVAKDETRT